MHLQLAGYAARPSTGLVEEAFGARLELCEPVAVGRLTRRCEQIAGAAHVIGTTPPESTVPT